MKKIYYPIYLIILFGIALWIYLFSGWEQLIVYLLLINILIYVVRRPLVNLVRILVKKKIIHILVSSIINIISLPASPTNEGCGLQKRISLRSL